MTRVVADTNVLVSAVIASGKPREFLRRCVAKEWTLVSSPPLLEEFAEVLRRPKLRLTEGDVLRALGALVASVQVVEPRLAVRVVLNDPDDDRVLEAALEGKALFIVSGDRHLLRLGNFEGIRIVTVADFLAAGDK
jgi:putative PIN family toxin of toxin-antitoxin system